MTQDITDFFDGLPARAAGKTAGMNNTYVFAIDGAGTWTVAVNDEGVTVTDGDQGGDCTIEASAETFSPHRSGEQNADHRVHDGQAEDQGRHGCCHEAPEAVLGRPAA